MSDLVKHKGNLPVTSMLLGGGLPRAPKRRKNNLIGNALTNMELRQILHTEVMQTEIVKTFTERQRLQQEFVMEQVTVNQRTKTMLQELETREVIAISKGEEAMASALEKKMRARLSVKKMQKQLDAMED